HPFARRSRDPVRPHPGHEATAGPRDRGGEDRSAAPAHAGDDHHAPLRRDRGAYPRPFGQGGFRMSNVSDVSNADTVWIEKDALIDRIPRSVAMALLFIVVVAIWDLVTRMGWVSPIILPSPAETLADLIFVGQNLISG